MAGWVSTPPPGGFDKQVARPAAKGRATTPNPLLNPSQPLQGKSLLSAAQALTNAQTSGPLKALAMQLAQNAKQGAGAQKATAGYFGALGQQAQAGSNAETGIANDLNSQLQGIQNDTQSRIAGFGQNATNAPGLQSLASTGLDGGALGNLAAEIARQQGNAAQNAGNYRAFGANQGANYRGLAASNLGTFALRGQERLGQIAQATRLAAEPINQQIASQQASRGALLATNEGKLRQQEISNALAQEGVQAGLTKAQIAAAQSNTNNLRSTSTSASNNALTNSTSAANAQLAAQTRLTGLQQSQMNSDRQFNLDKQKLGAAQAKNKYLQSHGLGPYKPASTSAGGGGGRSLSPAQSNSYWRNVSKGLAAFGALKQQGQSPQAIVSALQAGSVTGPDGKPIQMDALQAQAVGELWTYHYLNPQTAAALHRAGIRGGTYNGQPIRVGAPPGGNRQGALGGNLFGIPV